MFHFSSGHLVSQQASHNTIQCKLNPCSHLKFFQPTTAGWFGMGLMWRSQNRIVIRWDVVAEQTMYDVSLLSHSLWSCIKYHNICHWGMWRGHTRRGTQMMWNFFLANSPFPFGLQMFLLYMQCLAMQCIWDSLLNLTFFQLPWRWSAQPANATKPKGRTSCSVSRLHCSCYCCCLCDYSCWH